MKNFDRWNNIKKSIEVRNNELYFYPREIWLACLGLNIGSEQDGGGVGYIRPVLIIKKYTDRTMLVLPMTSKSRVGDYYYKIDNINRPNWIILTQSRVLDRKRLVRKIKVISDSEYEDIIDRFVGLLRR